MCDVIFGSQNQRIIIRMRCDIPTAMAVTQLSEPERYGFKETPIGHIHGMGNDSRWWRCHARVIFALQFAVVAVIACHNIYYYFNAD